ncbi:hypothetical protein Btru_009385 [Bulinus truncatus]|nr:hypothetical protein Btru_009385 [Bulinus truncatus]
MSTELVSLNAFYQETHECELSFTGETGLLESKTKCKKNPDHKHFIPVTNFSIKDLPPFYRDRELFDFIRATADLTVRIIVSGISPDRPDHYPGTVIPFPLSEHRGKPALATGSGKVARVYRHDGTDGEVCGCTKCVTSSDPNKIWGKVIVHTASHVVFDHYEAARSTAMLWYDGGGSAPVKGLEGARVTSEDAALDLCKVEFCACDPEVVDRLDALADRWEAACRSVREKFRGSPDGDLLAVIVSHPHGCYKQVTVGRWTGTLELEDARTKYVYTTDTCPGSSGAFVFTLGRDVSWFTEHVHAGSRSGGNCSCGGLDF